MGILMMGLHGQSDIVGGDRWILIWRGHIASTRTFWHPIMHPEVVSIIESRILKLATTYSFDFLGLHEKHDEDFHVNGSIWNVASYANIDSGVHSNHKSFLDESLGPIPKKFKGICANEHDPTFKCNRKLIGARYFYKGLLEEAKLYNMTFNETLSPRDKEGHGSHTLSMAGWSFVSEASLNGLANGTAMGLAPKARLVAYKVHWSEAASDMDVLAAFEAAIDDNVDIINLSMGSAEQGFLDSIAVGSFHAMKNSILTIAAAGNSGPALGTVANDEKVGSEIFQNVPRVVSTALISYNDGQTLFSYINSTRTPIVSFGEAITSLGIKSAPIMADFSSRGPHSLILNYGVLKPNVTAPGVDILAATPKSLEKKKENPFVLMSELSMATPHVSGVAALLKTIHPDWSTAAIQSSLMTIASPLDKKGMPIRDNDGVSEASHLAYGSGHIRPNLAMDPGLVYDMNEFDYLNLLCAINQNNTVLENLSKQHSYDCPRDFSALDANYPSIYVPEFPRNTIINHKLKNTGQPSTYLPRMRPHMEFQSLWSLTH
ncbi:subtilisin-like protease SBT5.4 [Amaranthus tricolor]|uniref:subtilisin-like protease SBT5.4 n=1 Tax=Amaranthus tricolor TaxID=29722 RepID=UPI00258F129A|nr:subtilisin-like protease SBT5.4 [Amaranthus tricolor]